MVKKTSRIIIKICDFFDLIFRCIIQWNRKQQIAKNPGGISTRGSFEPFCIKFRKFLQEFSPRLGFSDESVASIRNIFYQKSREF